MAKWTPQDDELALTLAAIRWYAISIEKLATDLYITDREMYPDVKKILGTCFSDLGKIRKHLYVQAKKAKKKGKRPQSYAAATTEQPKRQLLADDGCGPGYVNCYGACLPDCDDLEAY